MKAATVNRVVALDGRAPVSAAVVGGKAARLAELARAGLPVPPACAITADAFAEFCAVNRIERSLPAPDVAARIRTGVFPDALARALREHMARLPGAAFAVRSSALAEDGATFSMAGQLVTFLDVHPDDVERRVKECWAALFGPAVAAYATSHGLPRPAAMGVVVQQQVQPRLAGVLFSVDPVTGSADHFVVEWVRGLGDSLVAGVVTPQRALIARRRPVVPAGLAPDVGAALERVVALASQVERQMSCPVDIEWCADHGAVYLLQARPLTASTSAEADVWTATNMSENFPRPLSPLAWSVVDLFYTRYIECLADSLGVRAAEFAAPDSPARRLTGVMDGRVYYNIKSWYALLATFVPELARPLRSGLDHYIGQNVPVAMPDARRDAHPARRWLPRVKFWMRFARQLFRGQGYLARFEALFRELRRRQRATPHDRDTAHALMARIDDWFDGFMPRHWHRQGAADLSVLAFPGLVHALVARWLPGRNTAMTVAALLRTEGSEGTAAAHLIARMAAGVASDGKLLGLLRSVRYDELLDVLPPELRALYREFMERFGCRCYHECLIVTPTFEERPDLLWELVERYTRAERKPAAPREDPARAVLEGLSLRRRLVLRAAIRRARAAIELREQGRLVQSLLFGEIHTIAVALGRKLVALGHLAAADDVFLLDLAELRGLCAGKFLFPETIPALIALRRDALGRCATREPPECVVLPRATYVRHRARVVPPPAHGVWHGVAASRGRVRGRARVILDPLTDKLEPGEILVARSTDPGWTALFAIAGGLVLEKGGVLSHGAIVAREFGVPAVVGVEGVTHSLAGGESLWVDGDEGIVMLEPAA